MKKRLLLISLILIAAIGLGIVISANICSGTTGAKIEKVDSIEQGSWQAIVSFPDWKGYVDDTLAMNAMYSFDGYKEQGELYITVSSEVEEFELFVNNKKVDTKSMKDGIYKIDISNLTVNGQNTIQVSNIQPTTLEKAVIVNIPYPKVIEGTLEEVGLSKEPFELIDKIITSDVKNGFTSAQLAVIKDGKLVYQNAWGNLNSYNQDGTRIENGTKVTNDTMYDLASNTKMYSVAYGIQYLIDQGKINLDDKIVDIIGQEFVDNTEEIRFSAWKDEYPGFAEIKNMKSQITVKNVLMHQAGFPDCGHYHNEFYDTVNQTLSDEVRNVLYVSDATKEKTLKEGICKTPLIYTPESKTLYSDIDYMLLGLVIEKVTGQDLDVFLRETFWKPMGLEHITYNPLKNGYTKEDCAATEVNGDTRDGLISFPNARTYTIQGEVHDGEAYHTMEGVSGHAGLFANATDLAKLASCMLSGGYGNNQFFTKNTRDLFIAPQSTKSINYGIGWWREADDKRVWYFGTQAPESTIGHQGWTGTLTMIDYENDMVIVFLTNCKNTMIVNPVGLENANDFAGNYYTTSTLGFIPQLIYTGMNNQENPKEALNSLVKDMANEKQKLVDSLEKEAGGHVDGHPIYNAKQAIDDILK